MKTYCLVLIIFIILSIIGLVIYYFTRQISEDFNQDVYSSFKASLNTKNKKVRKNVWEYYQVPEDIKSWALNILNNNNKNNVFLSSDLYYGHPDLEFNYSHTMDKNIILSNHDYKKLEKYVKTNNIQDFLYDVGSTIVHEGMHILQRLYYNKFKQMYKEWGYVFPTHIIGIQPLLENKRQNPDANDDNILWNDGYDNYYFINCFFTNSTNVIRLAYPIYKSGVNYEYKGDDGIALTKLDEYNNYFGNGVGNNYTPNEICAEYTEILYLEGLKGDFCDYPAYQIFKQYNLTSP
jgi:hypothetical protein